MNEPSSSFGIAKRWIWLTYRRRFPSEYRSCCQWFPARIRGAHLWKYSLGPIMSHLQLSLLSFAPWRRTALLQTLWSLSSLQSKATPISRASSFVASKLDFRERKSLDISRRAWSKVLCNSSSSSSSGSRKLDWTYAFRELWAWKLLELVVGRNCKAVKSSFHSLPQLILAFFSSCCSLGDEPQPFQSKSGSCRITPRN